MKVAMIFAVIALLALSTGSDARQLLQGTNNTASNTVVRWLVPTNGILDAVRVPVNGTVTFSWTGLHDLWEIPSAQCPSSFTNGSGITQIARQVTGGTATVTFPEQRVRFFACSVSTHCSEGQLIAIRVGNATASGPAPGPSRQSIGGYSGNSSPGYTGGSSSNYGSSSNSTASSGYSGNSSPGYAGGSSSNYGSPSGKKK